MSAYDIQYRVKRTFQDDDGFLNPGDLPPIERSSRWANLLTLRNTGYIVIHGDKGKKSKSSGSVGGVDVVKSKGRVECRFCKREFSTRGFHRHLLTHEGE